MLTQEQEKIQELTRRATAAEARAARLEASNRSLAAHSGELSLQVRELEHERAELEYAEQLLVDVESALGCTEEGNALDAIARLQADLAKARAAESALHSLRERVRDAIERLTDARYTMCTRNEDALDVLRRATLDEPANEQPVTERRPPFTWTAEDRAKLVRGARVMVHWSDSSTDVHEVLWVGQTRVGVAVLHRDAPLGIEMSDCDPTTIIPPESDDCEPSVYDAKGVVT